LLFRGRKLDSRLALKKDPVRSIWVHEALLSRFASVEAYFLDRALPSRPGSPSCWREFGMEGYTYGLGLEKAPFAWTPAIRVTVGAWGKLCGSPERDPSTAYRVVVDELRFLWTLDVRE
jgi:hypothetical protein